ncbi:MAG: hypothetical protein M9941_02275 [Anaerolineae bacterium]|nr:hypothetical protein [Anaerolineae bacterium]MCO5196585.1 hypothetical protein [Anaerolineae bacterium]
MSARVLWLVLLLAVLVTACQETTTQGTDTPLPLPPTVIADSYPVATASELPDTTVTPSSADAATEEFDTFLPSVGTAQDATPTPTPNADSAEPQPTPTPSVSPTVDFAAARAELLAQGQELAFNKIGFHVGVGGNAVGIGDWMRRLDEAGVPFTLKSVDNSGPLVEAQEIMRNSDVPHVLIFRTTGNDVPDYNLSPIRAAAEHWAWHRDRFPPELDRNLVWLETMNELDKNRSEWLAEFALETARLARAEGFRWAAFGWAAGEPEPEDWEGPKMLEFLRLAGDNPDTIGIALHEGSFSVDHIAERYPYTIGRFLSLYETADRYGIPRPTVFITEWGWEAFAVPDPGKAIEHIKWAASLYAPFPEVKGAAIWYLGGGFDPIHEQAQRLIAPVTEYSLRNYFAVPQPPESAEADPDLYAP